MPGTKEGGAKARQTTIDKFGEDYWKRIGKFGGSQRSPKKGFGSNRELARLAGQKGGTISRRGSKQNAN